MTKKTASRINTSALRWTKIGFIAYVSCLQYFVIQLIVASRWSPAYSLSRNTISDLGNTSCSLYNARYVCSPWHNLMDVSFIVLGIAMIVGSMLVYRAFSRSGKSAIGFGSIAIGGFGVIMVGLFPENTIAALHGIGATLPFLIGNLGILLLSLALIEVPRWLRFYSALTALVALTALIFYSSGHYLGLGEGGIERVVGYPQPVWLTVVGLYGILSPPKKV